MPIFTYQCPCGNKAEKINTYKAKVYCIKCGEEMKRIPSLPGWRRDHTIVEQ